MPAETYSDHPILPLADGWHAVALSRDLPAGAPFPVILGGREIVIWRAESGAARAWVDRCPHRGMRLSLGFVRGDTLSCLYHGWRYRGEGGGCDRIPAHPDLVPPKTITVERYGAAEAAGLVWVRTGEGADAPAVADAGLDGAMSVTIDAPAECVKAILTLPDGMEAEVQPVLAARCRVHVTAKRDCLKAAIAFAEALRRRFETSDLIAAE